MGEHLSRKAILMYLAGLSKDKHSVDRHISLCNDCLLKITNDYDKMIKVCKEVRGSFKGYYAGKLVEDKMDFVRKHLIFCDRCFEEYEQFIERKELRVVDILLGYLRGFSFSGIGIPSYQPAVLSAKSKSNIRGIENLQELEKKGINAVVTDDSKGNLKVYLKSDKYDVSNVTVSIGNKKRQGFDAVASAKTTKSGIVNMGKINKIPPVKGENSYAIFISGLREKGN